MKKLQITNYILLFISAIFGGILLFIWSLAVILNEFGYKQQSNGLEKYFFWILILFVFFGIICFIGFFLFYVIDEIHYIKTGKYHEQIK